MVSPWRRSAKTSFTYSSWVSMSVGSSSSVPLQVPKLEGAVTDGGGWSSGRAPEPQLSASSGDRRTRLLVIANTPGGLAQIADTLSTAAAAGRLGQVADRWIYSACLCFGLDLDEQQRSGFRYEYSVYQ